ALDAAARLGWDAVLVGPGPGIIGSDSEYGHGGMAGLGGAPAARSLGLLARLSPRPSSSPPPAPPRAGQPPTTTLLELLLATVEVAVPDDDFEVPTAEGGTAAVAAAVEAAPGRHRVLPGQADLDGYEVSGLPTTTMGRSLREDPLFFAAPLAAGAAL